MRSSDDLVRELADHTRPILGAEGFSDERIDELAYAFVDDHVGEGEEQFVNWARAEGPFGIDPEGGL
jgi:hypothetical protein